jgi:hypothetical protein
MCRSRQDLHLERRKVSGCGDHSQLKKAHPPPQPGRDEEEEEEEEPYSTLRTQRNSASSIDHRYPRAPAGERKSHLPSPAAALVCDPLSSNRVNRVRSSSRVLCVCSLLQTHNVSSPELIYTKPNSQLSRNHHRDYNHRRTRLETSPRSKSRQFSPHFLCQRAATELRPHTRRSEDLNTVTTRSSANSTTPPLTQ